MSITFDWGKDEGKFIKIPFSCSKGVGLKKSKTVICNWNENWH